MKPSPTLSRRSILRMFPAAAAAATVVVLSANQAAAQARVPQQTADAGLPPQGHRHLIGVL